MKTKLASYVCAAVVALMIVSGCSKRKTQYQAIVEVEVSANCIGTSKLQFGKIDLSDTDLEKQADELKLAEKWSSPAKTASKEEVLQRLKAAIQISTNVVQLSPDVGGFVVRVIGSDPAECESIAKSVSLALKNKAEQAADRELSARIESRQKEVESIQERLSVTRKELVGAQKGNYVPSQYRLTPEYEAEMKAKIKNAQADDTARANELESLRKLQGEELRSALVKIEMGRIASTNLPSSTSSLLSVHQAQKSAVKELDMARSGAINESNAVGHAELKLEQANRNLTNTMDAYIKSLEIESEVAKARREEMERQLEKLRQTSQRSGEKAGIEKEIESLNAQLTTLAGEVEQAKLCQRMLAGAIQIGSIQVEPVRSR
jgi:hypothetical protein